MPREKVIRAERVLDCHRDSGKPFVTTVDIAEYLDVTDQSVRNNTADLKEHELLEWGKVGPSVVFWPAGEEPPAEPPADDSPPPGEELGQRESEGASNSTENQEPPEQRTAALVEAVYSRVAAATSVVGVAFLVSYLTISPNLRTVYVAVGMFAIAAGYGILPVHSIGLALGHARSSIEAWVSSLARDPLVAPGSWEERMASGTVGAALLVALWGGLIPNPTLTTTACSIGVVAILVDYAWHKWHGTVPDSIVGPWTPGSAEVRA